MSTEENKIETIEFNNVQLCNFNNENKIEAIAFNHQNKLIEWMNNLEDSSTISFDDLGLGKTKIINFDSLLNYRDVQLIIDDINCTTDYIFNVYNNNDNDLIKTIEILYKNESLEKKNIILVSIQTGCSKEYANVELIKNNNEILDTIRIICEDKHFIPNNLYGIENCKIKRQQKKNYEELKSMMPNWNENKCEQAIKRCIRYNSIDDSINKIDLNKIEVEIEIFESSLLIDNFELILESCEENINKGNLNINKDFLVLYTDFKNNKLFSKYSERIKAIADRIKFSENVEIERKIYLDEHINKSNDDILNEILNINHYSLHKIVLIEELIKRNDIKLANIAVDFILKQDEEYLDSYGVKSRLKKILKNLDKKINYQSQNYFDKQNPDEPFIDKENIKLNTYFQQIKILRKYGKTNDEIEIYLDILLKNNGYNFYLKLLDEDKNFYNDIISKSLKLQEKIKEYKNKYEKYFVKLNGDINASKPGIIKFTNTYSDYF